ncbi:hypothetical protein C8R46DRAFT_1086947 [Mycena filopes]|nr:hypothetical protein C8R46DRAFT_1086947 [Mycena filopes]
MSRLSISSFFEGKDAKRARVEAEIVERSERFRASPTVKIGTLTVINPVSCVKPFRPAIINFAQTYEGPNPFQAAELLDPENEGVILAATEADKMQRSKKRRDRAKSEAYSKTPWSLDDGQVQNLVRNPRYSAPPLSRVGSEVGFASEEDDDPFRKDPLSSSTQRPNSFFLDTDLEEEKRKVVSSPVLDFVRVSEISAGSKEDCGLFAG